LNPRINEPLDYRTPGLSTYNRSRHQRSWQWVRAKYWPSVFSGEREPQRRVNVRRVRVCLRARKWSHRPATRPANDACWRVGSCRVEAAGLMTLIHGKVPQPTTFSHDAIKQERELYYHLIQLLPRFIT